MSDKPGKCRLCDNALDTLPLFSHFTICIQCISEGRCSMCGEHIPSDYETPYCDECHRKNEERNNKLAREHVDRPRYQNIA